MIIVITIIISTTTFQYITEKLEKMTLLLSQFWGCYCRPRCFILPNSKKGVINLQQIISKHQQALISTAI